MEENRDVIEGFGRAVVKGTKFGFDPANRDKVLAHAAAANPQEGEDTALANALLDQLLIKQDIGDQAEGYGYLPPEGWEVWQQTLLDSGDLKEAQDLSKAFTNEFVETWNAE
jgi:NitT/TauT family transport system substrate-binding protein